MSNHYASSLAAEMESTEMNTQSVLPYHNTSNEESQMRNLDMPFTPPMVAERNDHRGEYLAESEQINASPHSLKNMDLKLQLDYLSELKKLQNQG